MDYSKLDVDRLSPEALGTSLNRRNAILEMLLKKGYIDGIAIKKYVDKESILGLGNIKITVFRGTYFSPPENPRQGVHIKDAKETLLKGAVGKTMTNTRGQKSVVYIGDKCNVTINPDTGMLIQTNPSRKKVIRQCY